MSSFIRIGRICFLLSSFWSLSSSAADGVFEINQTCAANDGCFSGDAASFPVTISSPGSYVLTGNLSIPDEDTTAIEITSDHVTLDLNGFEIAGINTCTDTPVTGCLHSASGQGITGDQLNDIEIRNGTIRGMGGDGIRLSNGEQHRVINIRVLESGQRGIYVSDHAVIANSLASRNRFDGLYLFTAAVVSDNQVNGNGLSGITTTTSALISGNVVFNNEGDGIRTTSTSSIIGNNIQSNGGIGINSTAVDSYYSQNVILDNTGATVVNGVEFGTNICNGNTTCP